jgi:hypothetical protein
MRLILYVFGIILSATAPFADPRFWQYEFPETDFSKTSLESWLEIRSGGVGKDGIPALDYVEMIALADANIPAKHSHDGSRPWVRALWGINGC